jgi:2-dehydro-3-deoxygluconokinase
MKAAAIGECMVEMLDEGGGLYRRGHAGDTFNAAQYLSWAGKGLEVSYVTALGEDRFGRDMLCRWKESGLDTSLVMTTKEKSTGLYFADVNEKGDRDYTFYRSDSAAKRMFRLPRSGEVFTRVLDCQLVYASAITLMILDDEDRAKLVELFRAARAKGAKTAFDTNYRPSGWASPARAAEWISRIAPHVDIVLPTFDENRAVFGDENEEATLARFRALGVREVVCKSGAGDCRVFHGGEITAVPAVAGVQVVDTTAAGDSFNGAYLAGRLSGLPPEKAARWGHLLAAEVIRHRGAIIPREAMPVLA